MKSEEKKIITDEDIVIVDKYVGNEDEGENKNENENNLKKEKNKDKNKDKEKQKRKITPRELITRIMAIVLVVLMIGTFSATLIFSLLEG